MTAGEAIFHITTPDGWAAAQAAGVVRPPSLAEEGFVHCSTESQLAATIGRHFVDAAELVLLRLRREVLDDELRWEAARHGESYPHLYRPIALDEVAEAIPYSARQ